MGCGSGLANLSEVFFESPVAGGRRSVTIATDWSSLCGKGYVGSGKAYPIWFYAFRDEITEAVAAQINEELERVAIEHDLTPVKHVEVGDKRAFSLAEVKREANERWELLKKNGRAHNWRDTVYCFTGSYALTERVPGPPESEENEVE